MKSTQVDLLKGSTLKALILFAIPFLISNIFQQLYNTVDTVIVGHYLGDKSLAAIGASGSIFSLIMGLALGIGSGMSIVIGRCYGAEDEKLLKKSIAATIIIGGCITLVLAVLSRYTLMPLLRLQDTPMEIIDEAYAYIDVIILYCGVMIAFNICQGILKAIGNSLIPLLFLAVSSVLNIILDVLFIRQFHMGIRGAAIATVISQAVSTIMCLLYIWKKCKFLIPSREHFVYDKKLYTDLISQGVSMGMMTCLVSLGSFVLQYAINQLGYLMMAGHVAAKRLFSFTVMPLVTMCLSLTNFVAQNKGAGQVDRIRKAVRYANIVSIVWSIFITIVVLFAAPFMVRKLTGSSEPSVIEYGSMFIRIETMFYIVLGPLFNYRYALQGIGRKVIPLVSSLIELLGKIVFTFFLFSHTGYMGIILCEPVIWCVMLLQLIFAYYRDPYIKEFGMMAVITSE